MDPPLNDLLPPSSYAPFPNIPTISVCHLRTEYSTPLTVGDTSYAHYSIYTVSSFTAYFKPSDHSKELVASVKEELPLEWPLWDPIVGDSETQQDIFLTVPGSQEDGLLDCTPC